MKAFTVEVCTLQTRELIQKEVGLLGLNFFLDETTLFFHLGGGGGIWPPRQIPVYCRPNPYINYMNFQMLYDKWWKLEEKYVFFIIMNLKGIVDVHQVILNMYCRLPCTIHDGTGLVMDE